MPGAISRSVEESGMRIQAYEMQKVGAPLVKTERELGDAGPGEAIVAVAGCGVCHTDLGFLYDGVPTRHPLPLILGHEVSGIVVSAGGAAADLVGRSVVVPAVLPCGRCALCRHGRGDICRKQIFPGCDVDGGFASHLKVPSAGLCALPATLQPGPDLARLSVSADAVSTAYQVVLKSGLAAGQFAVFIGVGGVGGFGLQIARALGARVLAIDVSDERLQLMTECGADWTLNVRELPVKETRKKVRALAEEAGAGQTEWRIFETSGTPAGQELAWALLTWGAYLGVVGYAPADVTVRLSNLMAFAARAEGTWGCLPEHFPAVLDLVLSGRVAVDPFIEFHPMSTINEVLERLHRGELRRRPVLIPDF